MISEIPASPEARERREGAALLRFPVRRGAVIRYAFREIRKNGPVPPHSVLPMRRQELEKEILALWEG